MGAAVLLASVLMLVGCAGDPLQSAGESATRESADLLVHGLQALSSRPVAEVQKRLTAGDFGTIRVEVYLNGRTPSLASLAAPQRFYLTALQRHGQSLDARVLVVNHVQVGTIGGQEQGLFYSCGQLARDPSGHVTSQPAPCPKTRYAFTYRATGTAWPT